MPTLITDDIDLHYQLSGLGPPLVLIGGLTTNSAIWSEMAPRLEKCFRLICPDNRGAGQTKTRNKDLSIEQMAKDINLLLEHLNLESAYVVGHSMGGMIAQCLALQFPDKVNKLIIASSAAKIDTHALYHIKTSVELLEQEVPLQLILKTVIPWLYADNFLLNEKRLQQEIDRIVNDPLAQSPEDYAKQVRAIEHFDLRKKIRSISCKTLILVGNDDVLIRKETSKEQLFHEIKDAFFEVIDDCGHMMQREKPEQFCEIIEDFILKK